MKPTGNTILITGGGSGIGQELAHRYHNLGNTVIIAGRRLEALQQAAQGFPNIIPMQLDIDSADAIQAFAHKLLAAYPQLNVIINNAGIMRMENIAEPRNLTDATEMVTTNLLGPIRLIDAFVKHLSTQPNAAIINVTSGLAFVPLASAATYSATKAAMHSYTQSLKHQLQNKVEVIELAPPAVQTHLTPGQATREGYMPLEDYANEAFSLLTSTPTPAEALVERVKFLRFAEQEQRHAQTFTTLNSHH